MAEKAFLDRQKWVVSWKGSDNRPCNTEFLAHSNEFLYRRGIVEQLDPQLRCV